MSLHDALPSFTGQGVFIASLRCGQNEQVFKLFIAYQRLVKGGLALNDIDEVIDHTAFAAHDQVQVAQADVEIDDDGFMAFHRQSGRSEEHTSDIKSLSRISYAGFCLKK